MKGNMTGAVKKIEKMNRGLSDEPDVADALRKANESVNEAGTKSIDGEELLNYLQKRFKMSRKQAIASMKKHNMDVSSIKKESVNEGTWPDTQTARLLSQAFKDAKVKVQKVWENNSCSCKRWMDKCKNGIECYK